MRAARQRFWMSKNVAFNAARTAMIAFRHAKPETSAAGTLTFRLVIATAALAILYWRTPITFIHPQFWAEDWAFFEETRLFGWESLTASTWWAGYLCLAQVLVGHLANWFNPEFAGAIFCYSAILLTLAVVWLATSPRLEMPAKPILAFAIVIVPMGYEEVGALANIQWILALGGFLLMFMRPANPRLILCAEAAFLAITSVSGPFSVFLTPLFVWQTYRADEPAARRRLMVLTSASALGALIQVWFIMHRTGHGVSAGPGPPYPWTLWVDLPFQRWMTNFGPASDIFQGVFGAVLGICGLAIAAVLACLRPFRVQKLSMLFFALAIAYSGMYRFHNILPTEAAATRYFYAGSVLSFSFICCLSSQIYMRPVLFACAAAAELLLLPTIHNTSRVPAQNLEWPVWASYINSGLSVVIPIAPAGNALTFPANQAGPLSAFASWPGRNVAEVALVTPPSSCQGYMGPADRIWIVELLQEKHQILGLFAQWIASGTAWDATVSQPARLVVVTDATGKITGFGLPGFRAQPGEPSQSQPEWRSIFPGASGSTARAYAVLNDGRHICPLANVQYLNEAFPSVDQPRVSRTILRAVYINRGADIEQSFGPTHRLRAISLVFVTGGKRPSRYDIDWRVTGLAKGKAVELGHGQIDAHNLTDWVTIQLPLSLVPEQIPAQINVAFWTDSMKNPRVPAAFPLYKPAPGDSDPPFKYDGNPAPDGAQMDFFVTYLK